MEGIRRGGWECVRKGWGDQLRVIGPLGRSRGSLSMVLGLPSPEISSLM